MKYLWMKATADRYELPVAVADSAGELARMLGVSENAVRRALWFQDKGERKRSRYVRVAVDDEEEDENDEGSV